MKIKKTTSNCNKSKRSRWSQAASWSRYHPRTIWGSAPPPKSPKRQTSKNKTQVKAKNFLIITQARKKCSSSIRRTRLEIRLSSKPSKTKIRASYKKTKVWRLRVTAMTTLTSSSSRQPNLTTTAWRKSPKTQAKEWLELQGCLIDHQHVLGKAVA